MKTFKCPICHEEHEIDSTGWVQSCIGYFELGNMIYEIEKWLEEKLKGGTKGRITTKGNTKGNTKRVKKNGEN